MEFDKGDIVLYHERVGIVTDLYNYLYATEPLVKIYFFDVNSEAVLDACLIREATEAEYGNAMRELQSHCDCGEKYVEVPIKHSKWCNLRKIKEGKAYEILKGSGKMGME